MFTRAHLYTVAAAAYRSGTKLTNEWDGMTHDYTRKGGIVHAEIMLPAHAPPEFADRSILWNSVEQTKLTNEWDGMTHDYTRKGGIVHAEIMLPAHAPPEFADRSILWNSVEQIEKARDSQLAREIEAALPRELSGEQQLALVRAYVKDNFVYKGMCADFAIHDKGTGYPHVHIMLTLHSVEQIDKARESQLAREIESALTRELSGEQQLALVRAYVKDNFVDKGMCADFAIHDKGTGNPHVHIMLTLRPLKENGQWGAKCRKAYDLDENGQRIPDGKGGWKNHREDTTDWNDKGNVEIWRAAWAAYTNRALESAGRPERIDHRSYKRQGIDKGRIRPTGTIKEMWRFGGQRGQPTPTGRWNLPIDRSALTTAATSGRALIKFPLSIWGQLPAKWKSAVSAPTRGK